MDLPQLASNESPTYVHREDVNKPSGHAATCESATSAAAVETADVVPGAVAFLNPMPLEYHVEGAEVFPTGDQQDSPVLGSYRARGQTSSRTMISLSESDPRAPQVALSVVDSDVDQQESSRPILTERETTTVEERGDGPSRPKIEEGLMGHSAAVAGSAAASNEPGYMHPFDCICPEHLSLDTSTRKTAAVPGYSTSAKCIPELIGIVSEDRGPTRPTSLAIDPELTHKKGKEPANDSAPVETSSNVPITASQSLGQEPIYAQVIPRHMRPPSAVPRKLRNPEYLSPSPSPNPLPPRPDNLELSEWSPSSGYHTPRSTPPKQSPCLSSVVNLDPGTAPVHPVACHYTTERLSAGVQSIPPADEPVHEMRPRCSRVISAISKEAYSSEMNTSRQKESVKKLVTRRSLPSPPSSISESPGGQSQASREQAESRSPIVRTYSEDSPLIYETETIASAYTPSKEVVKEPQEAAKVDPKLCSQNDPDNTAEQLTTSRKSSLSHVASSIKKKFQKIRGAKSHDDSIEDTIETSSSPVPASHDMASDSVVRASSPADHAPVAAASSSDHATARSSEESGGIPRVAKAVQFRRTAKRKERASQSDAETNSDPELYNWRYPGDIWFEQDKDDTSSPQ